MISVGQLLKNDSYEQVIFSESKNKQQTAPNGNLINSNKKNTLKKRGKQSDHSTSSLPSTSSTSQSDILSFECCLVSVTQVKWDNCPTYKILLEEFHLRSVHSSGDPLIKTQRHLVWLQLPLPLILEQYSFYDETHQYCICSVHSIHNRELTVCSAKKWG